jgi:perosamine synthetase
MIFRIHVYLKLSIFFKSFFFNIESIEQKLKKQICIYSKKNFCSLTGFGRTSLLLVLRFIRKKYPDKKEILIQSYNLQGFVEVVKFEKFNIKFFDIKKETGSVSMESLRKSVNKNTAAIIYTNMFSSYSELNKIKQYTKKNKIILIEDNAIFFDNFLKKNGKKIYTGQTGDFSIFSFNIMKNISSFYGGAVSYNSVDFERFCNDEIKKFTKFPSASLIKQIFIFFILKIFSIKIFYKNIFFKVIKASFKNNINFLINIMYPSQKFFPNKQKKIVYSQIHPFCSKLTLMQFQDIKNRKNNFVIRKNNNIYLHKKISPIVKNARNFFTFKLEDFNYQNTLDYPLIVECKKNFLNFMFNNNIELRFFHYYDCEKIFSKNSTCKVSNYISKNIVCIPTHPMITKEYLDRIVKLTEIFIKNPKCNF